MYAVILFPDECFTCQLVMLTNHFLHPQGMFLNNKLSRRCTLCNHMQFSLPVKFYKKARHHTGFARACSRLLSTWLKLRGLQSTQCFFFFREQPWLSLGHKSTWVHCTDCTALWINLEDNYLILPEDSEATWMWPRLRPTQKTAQNALIVHKRSPGGVPQGTSRSPTSPPPHSSFVSDSFKMGHCHLPIECKPSLTGAAEGEQRDICRADMRKREEPVYFDGEFFFFLIGLRGAMLW